MKYCLLIFLAASLLLPASPALAHRPYYTQVEKILLPNGDIGEVRLLNGDGILVADPVRAIVVSPLGMLLARSPKTRSMAMSCDDKHQCLVVDLRKARVFELDAQSFRNGTVQPEVSSGDVTDDWDLEAGDDSWGFAVRDATSAERFSANWTLARETRGGLIFLAVLGALGGFFVAVPIRISIQSAILRVLAHTLLFLGRMLIFGCFAAFAFMMLIVGGGSLEFSLLAFLLGGCVVGFAAAIIRMRTSPKRNA